MEKKKYFPKIEWTQRMLRPVMGFHKARRTNLFINTLTWLFISHQYPMEDVDAKVHGKTWV